MSATLKAHIEKYIRVSDADFAGILSFFETLAMRKKANLLTEGKVCRYHYFVVRGCLRMFFVNEKGVEQTTHFALEQWWLSDYASFESGKASDFYIQAVEQTEVLVISAAAQEAMLQQYPQMERYFRLVYQRANAAAQFRIKALYSLSREALYHHFNSRYPEFVQRIPQYLLASFLGFTPEYLSEIRSRRIS